MEFEPHKHFINQMCGADNSDGCLFEELVVMISFQPIHAFTLVGPHVRMSNSHVTGTMQINDLID